MQGGGVHQSEMFVWGALGKGMRPGQYPPSAPPPPPHPSSAPGTPPPLQVVNNLINSDLSDPPSVISKMLLTVHQSPANPLFVALKAKLLPVLRDVLMYQHRDLVSTALSLIFRLIMMRSETTGLLQEVQLLHSQEMVDTYRQACAHAIRLQSVFDNKTNLRGQWCSAMQQVHVLSGGGGGTPWDARSEGTGNASYAPQARRRGRTMGCGVISSV